MHGLVLDFDPIDPCVKYESHIYNTFEVMSIYKIFMMTQFEVGHKGHIKFMSNLDLDFGPISLCV